MPVEATRTLIIGAGITGAALARHLHDARQSIHHAHARAVVVWEKNSIVGGRMMARSFRKNRHVHVDMGAQYLTRLSRENDALRDVLMAQGHLTPFAETRIAQDPTHPVRGDADAQHAIAPHGRGFGSVVSFLFQDATMHLGRELTRFELTADARLRVIAADGSDDVVDQLVLTCPIPSVLVILRQSAFTPLASQLAALQRVSYSQRFAVAYLFDASLIASDVSALHWVAKYVARQEDDVVRYLCWDNLKKQAPTNATASTATYISLLVHTSVPFGVANMDRDDEQVLATITASVKRLLPFLPEPQDALLHRWRLSQVTTPYQEEAGASPSWTPPCSIVLHETPRIVVAGDAFLGSVFDNCLLSAAHAFSAL